MCHSESSLRRPTAARSLCRGVHPLLVWIESGPGAEDSCGCIGPCHARPPQCRAVHRVKVLDAAGCSSVRWHLKVVLHAWWVAQPPTWSSPTPPPEWRLKRHPSSMGPTGITCAPDDGRGAAGACKGWKIKNRDDLNMCKPWAPAMLATEWANEIRKQTARHKNQPGNTPDSMNRSATMTQ